MTSKLQHNLRMRVPGRLAEHSRTSLPPQGKMPLCHKSPQVTSTATGTGLSCSLPRNSGLLLEAPCTFWLAAPFKIVSLLFLLWETNVSSPVLGNDPAIPSQIALGQLRKHHADAEQILYSQAVATKHKSGQGCKCCLWKYFRNKADQTTQVFSESNLLCFARVAYSGCSYILNPGHARCLPSTSVSSPHQLSSLLTCIRNSGTLTNIILKRTAFIYLFKSCLKRLALIRISKIHRAPDDTYYHGWGQSLFLLKSVGPLLLSSEAAESIIMSTPALGISFCPPAPLCYSLFDISKCPNNCRPGLERRHFHHEADMHDLKESLYSEPIVSKY